MMKRIGSAAAVLACLSLAAPTPLAGQDTLDPPPPTEEPARPEAGDEQPQEARTDRPPPREDRDRIDAGLAVGSAVVAGVLLCALFCSRTKQPPTRDELIEDGPRLGAKYKLGSFPVHGLVRAGWPLIVDFRAEPGTFTWVEITTGDERKEVIWLETGRQGGFFRAVREIPFDLGADGAEPALLVVRSARTAGGGLVLDQRGEPIPAPIEVNAIGCGPGAVGSIAIDRLSLRQLGPQPGSNFAAFGYQAVKPFNRSAAMIVSFRARGNEIEEKIVRSFSGGPLAAQQRSGGAWDGLAERSKRTRGVHRLQVRAWKSGDDLSWVGAVSRDRVTIP